MLRMMLILSVFCVCISVPLMVSAQSGLGGIVATVDKLDRNFDAADSNRDGLLSKEEAKAGQVGFIVANFDGIDTSHRGLVSKDEVHDFIKRSLLRNQPAPGSSSM